ncbi:hypothetical protein MNBD_GAMMA13-1492, partial [hydrothermal vent metagenome]
EVKIDANGQLVIENSPSIKGSGIRNFAPPGTPPGNVFLFAPGGTISAGDAGIGSAGNVTLAAVALIGTDNIDVGGTAAGFTPANATVVSTGGLATSNTLASSTNLAEETSSLDDDGRNIKNRQGILLVELLGLDTLCDEGSQDCNN